MCFKIQHLRLSGSNFILLINTKHKKNNDYQKQLFSCRGSQKDEEHISQWIIVYSGVCTVHILNAQR